MKRYSSSDCGVCIGCQPNLVSSRNTNKFQAARTIRPSYPSTNSTHEAGVSPSWYNSCQCRVRREPGSSAAGIDPSYLLNAILPLFCRTHGRTDEIKPKDFRLPDTSQLSNCLLSSNRCDYLFHHFAVFRYSSHAFHDRPSCPLVYRTRRL